MSKFKNTDDVLRNSFHNRSQHDLRTVEVSSSSSIGLFQHTYDRFQPRQHMSDATLV